MHLIYIPSGPGGGKKGRFWGGMKYFVLFCGLLGATGCVTSRYLEPGEQLLYQQRIHKTKPFDRTELRPALGQRHNRRFFFVPWWLPYAELHQYGLRRYDKEKYQAQIAETEARYEKKIEARPRREAALQARSNKRLSRLKRKIKEGNPWMRIGTPLARYRPRSSMASAQNLRSYTEQQGYFNTTVHIHRTSKKKRMYVKYALALGKPYYLDSISYHIDNPALAAALPTYPAAHILRKGDRYQQSTLEEARNYVHYHILNLGFYGFPQKQIRFVADTATLGDHKVWLHMHINKPTHTAPLQRYTQDSVVLWVAPTRFGTNYTPSYRGLYFNTQRYRRLLARKTFIQPGSYYSVSHSEQTRFMLGSMDVFRFIDIEQDTSQNVLHTHIRMHAHRKYALSQETGLEINQGNLPNPFILLNLKIRDFLRLLEVTDISTRFIVESISGPSQRNQPYRNFEYSTQISLKYPDILFPYVWSRKLKPSLNQKRSILNLGFFINNRRDYQRYRNTLTMSYEWNHGQRLSYGVSFLDVNLISARLSESFRQQIRTLYNSFSRSFRSTLSSSVSLRATWNYRYTGFSQLPGYQIRGFLETGGNLNRLYKKFVEKRGLEQYHFYKASLEYVHNVPVIRSSNLVWRLHIGAAVPYGKNTALPYEKYFFSGGSNSMRAWRPRRLGPGSYTPPGIESGIVEQPGELILEANLELRSHLGGRWHTACFIDVGNIWFTKKSRLNQGAFFVWPSSLKDIAVGIGTGLRMDLSFFFLRIDLGIKTYDPTQPLGKRFVLPKLLWQDVLGSGDRALLNIAINYPF